MKDANVENPYYMYLKVQIMKSINPDGPSKFELQK